MDGLKFEWNHRKDTANRKKHGVSFAEAKTAFFDEDARVMADPDHSEEEDRFILLGLNGTYLSSTPGKQCPSINTVFTAETQRTQRNSLTKTIKHFALFAALR
jgi:hypothetical protein